jgi:hypothetical protein
MIDDVSTGEKSRRQRILRVVVDASEAERIAALAKAADHSVSGYLRRVGLGAPLKSVLDQHLILELIKINGDQGRLGGLLKLWLLERPGAGASAFDVRKLLRQIEAAQTLLQTAIKRL